MAKYNPDELVAPPFMNEAYFQQTLRTVERDPNLTVSSIDVKPGSSAGDHFASIMFRVTIEYDSPKYRKRNERLTVIAKTLPVEGLKAEIMKDSPIFVSEIRMYQSILPEMERLFQFTDAKGRFYPNLVFGGFDPAPMLMLEDLSPKGYTVLQQPLGLTDAVRMGKMLGRFHAASLYMNANGTDLTNFDKSFFSTPPGDTPPPMDFLNGFLVPVFQLVTDQIATWPGYEKYGEKLNKLVKENALVFKRIYSETERNTYNVLNHSDFHFKNIMVTLAGDKVDDILLLDYQFPLWASPAVDVIYFLFMMINAETRQNHREGLIRTYHEEFVNTLKAIGYLGKIPTLLDLNIELLKNGVHEILLVFVFMMFQFMDFSEVDPSEFFNLDDPFAMHKKIIVNPKYQDALKAELPRWKNLGFLDTTL